MYFSLCSGLTEISGLNRACVNSSERREGGRQGGEGGREGKGGIGMSEEYFEQYMHAYLKIVSSTRTLLEVETNCLQNNTYTTTNTETLSVRV